MPWVYASGQNKYLSFETINRKSKFKIFVKYIFKWFVKRREVDFHSKYLPKIHNSSLHIHCIKYIQLTSIA